MPRVSVIMPTYKRDQEILKRAINSVICQTYHDVELIVIDDNAGEGLGAYRASTIELTKTYRGRVVYVENEQNLGGALSRNVGIQNASGEFITFLDDDDRYLPQKIEHQVLFMRDNELDVSFTDLRLCNKNEKTIDYREHSLIKAFDKNSLLRYHLMRHITGTPTFMYRKEVIDKIGGFVDAKVSQEYYLMFNTILADVKIGYLPLCYIVAYRQQSGGISGGKHKILWEKKLYQFKKQYFYLLNRKEQRFVTFRYYAVLAVSAKRNKMVFACILYGIKAVATSPTDTVLETGKLLKKIIGVK